MDGVKVSDGTYHGTMRLVKGTERFGDHSQFVHRDKDGNVLSGHVVSDGVRVMDVTATMWNKFDESSRPVYSGQMAPPPGADPFELCLLDYVPHGNGRMRVGDTLYPVTVDMGRVTDISMVEVGDSFYSGEPFWRDEKMIHYFEWRRRYDEEYRESKRRKYGEYSHCDKAYDEILAKMNDEMMQVLRQFCKVKINGQWRLGTRFTNWNDNDCALFHVLFQEQDSLIKRANVFKDPLAHNYDVCKWVASLNSNERRQFGHFFE